MTTVQIDDGAALGIARSALRAQAALATEEATKAIRDKSPVLAGIWAKVSATFGRTYLELAEAKFL